MCITDAVRGRRGRLGRGALSTPCSGNPPRNHRAFALALVIVCASACTTGARVGKGSGEPVLPRVGDVSADTASCVVAFDSLEAVFRHDYPGYMDKTAGREAHLAALIDSVRVAAAASDEHSICIPALWRYTSFFRDPHVALWQAGPPQPSQNPPPAAPANDPRAPSAHSLDEQTVLLRLPSFDIAYVDTIHRLIEEHRQMLLRMPFLIVDVRDNGGGFTGSFGPLLPFLYAGPFVRRGVDIRASAANVEHLRSYLTAESVAESLRAQIRALLPLLERRAGEFVTLVPDATVQMDTVFPNPRRVAILVNRGCASSCENLVLDARQSSKVTIIGTESTRGMVDYGNVRSVWLPGWRRLRIPTTRARWVTDSPLDGIGIAPAVLLPAGTSDAVAAALTYLRTASLPD